MAELKRTELTVIKEKALLVGLAAKGEDDDLEELESLAKTARAEVVGKCVQRKRRIDPAYYVGRGKADELKDLCSSLDADVIIFDNNLTPAQARNLELLCDVKVLDRSELILDIFATRARTHQAKLQVELAQLEYALPRLKRMWTHLSRMEGGIGMRGPGEQQLEEDRRAARKRIGDLKSKIKAIEERKERQVRSRSDFYTVCIVGYTNAGKSTLMNAITATDMLVEDKLFATLDTKTHLWRLPGLENVLLSDTVGFIRKLPHHLVTSFKATLEEAAQADLLLHVVDVTRADALEQIEAVEAVLDELGLAGKATLMVFNKIDMLRDGHNLVLLEERWPVNACASALKGTHLDRLGAMVVRLLRARHVEIQVRARPSEGKVLAYLAKHAQILRSDYADNSVVMDLRIDPRHLAVLEREFKGALIDVRFSGHTGSA